MSIKRYENIRINSLTFDKSAFGEQTTTITKWFDTRALVSDVANSLRISERYRVYQDMTNFMINYTLNAKTIVNRQDLYSITWRGHDWRITDVRETNDRQHVILMCYRTDPVTAV